MVYLFNLISWITGIVCGWLLNELMDSLKDKHKKRQREINNQKLLRQLSEKDYSLSIGGHILLEHGTPYYFFGNLHGKIVDRNFFYPIPLKFKQILSELSFCQIDCEDFEYTDIQNCIHDRFWGKEAFDTGFAVIGNYRWDEITKKIVAEIAEEVAEQFILDIRKGMVRFNGLLFGVASFKPNRTNGVEEPTASLDYYKTDYFTFQVFSHFYQRHKLPEENRISNEIVNKLCYPFLCSFGVDVLAVISTNSCEADLEDSDVLVIGKRSQNVMVHKGCLHFTMNEALSLRDTNIGEPSFEICATRGFNEELKWSNVRGIKFGDFRFMDFTLNKNGEMAIFGYVKLSLNKNVSIEEVTESLNKLYKESQDGILETDGLEFITMKEARSFLQSNLDKMSIGFAEGLDCFLRRYELSLI